MGSKLYQRLQPSNTKRKRPDTPKEEPESGGRKPASGIRPFIIPIFVPHAGCPHRCVFCNQALITGQSQKALTPQEVRTRITKFLSYKGKKRKPVQIAFFGGNFLGIKISEIKSLLAVAAGFVNEGAVDGIRFSTRPDTIDPDRLSLIQNFPVSTIELGAQSMDDRVLDLSRRGHSRSDTVQAVRLLKQRDYEIGLQVMIGLPADTKHRALETARQIAELKPDFVRIYPTLVLEGSPLARWYQTGKYIPLTLEEAVLQAKDLYLLFKDKSIKTIRMGLQASEDLDKESTILAGPYHPAFGHMVYSEIFLGAVKSILTKAATNEDHISIHLHPMSISKMRGLNNSNIHTLKKEFNLKTVAVVPDSGLGDHMLRVNDGPPNSIYLS